MNRATLKPRSLGRGDRLLETWGKAPTNRAAAGEEAPERWRLDDGPLLFGGFIFIAMWLLHHSFKIKEKNKVM